MLRKLIALMVWIASIHFSARCQQPVPINPVDIRLVPNGVGGFSISVEFILDMKDESIDPDYWLTASKPLISLKYAASKASDCKLIPQLYLRPNGFGVKLTGFNRRLLDRFLNKDKDNQITLEAETDVIIQLMKKNGEAQNRYWGIKKEVINKMINETLVLTDDQRTGFLTALNNFFYYENLVDFGIKPAQDSMKSSYFLTLRFQNIYSRKKLLACSNKDPKPLLYWNIKGRLSTNFNDSLNFIDIYPVNFLWECYTTKIPYRWQVKIGNESDQTFSNKRVTLDLLFTFITPNLINLTNPKSNRLRLKPILSLGVKGYHDYSNGIGSFNSGQGFLNGYYYIPVFNNYAIIVEGLAFYDFSKERNPDKKLQGNYSITLGAEIPKTGFKAMFKYVNGKSDINAKQGRIIALGLLMDLFQEKLK